MQSILSDLLDKLSALPSKIQEIDRRTAFLVCTTILAAIWAIFTWMVPSKPPPGNLAVVGLSTTSLDEAADHIRVLASKGYQAKAYSTQNGYYAVTIGIYPPSQAELVKREAVASRAVRADVFLLPKNALIREVFVEAPSGERFIKTGTFRVKANAIRKARDLRAEGYRAKVYLDISSSYIVVVGPLQDDAALQIKDKGIEMGIWGKDAHPVKGSDFISSIDLNDE